MSGNRFQTRQEIKELLSEWHEGQPGGPVLLTEHGKNYVYDGECQTLLIGSTGSGKSRHCSQVTVRILALAGENMILADPKGELVRRHRSALKKLGYRVITINLKDLNDPERSGWNPLAYPYDLYRSGDPVRRNYAFELICNLAQSILPEANTKDIFWIDSARSIFIGCCAALFEVASPEQVTLESVYQMVTTGAQRFASNTYLGELASYLPPESTAALQLQTFTSCTASDTRAGMTSTLLTALAPFARSEELMSMLSYDEVNISQMDGTQKTAIFVVFPDSTSTYDALAGVAIQSIMQHLIYVADRNPDGKLAIRHNLIVEEAGSIGKSVDLPNLFMAGRSRNLRILCILQSLFSLEAMYGPAQAAAIRSSADLLVCMRCNNLQTMKEITELCGEREVECGSNQYAVMPLIRPTEIQQFQTGQALVMLKGKKFMADLPSVDDLFPNDESKLPDTLPAARSTKRPPFFDIKGYVTNKRQQSLRESAAPKEKPKEEASPATSPWDNDPLLSPPAPIDFEKMMADIDKRLAEIAEEECSGSTVSDSTGPFTLMLNGEQTGTKAHVADVLHTVLHLPQDAARTAAATAPCVLLHSLYAPIANELAMKLSVQGVHTQICANAMANSLNAISGNRCIMLLRQDPQETRLALMKHMGFTPKIAREISQSLPCVVAKGLRLYTAKHLKSLFDQASIACVIDHDNPND